MSGIAVALSTLSLSPAANAAPTVLDFEDITAPATIRTQYSGRGVLFNFAFLSRAPLFSPNTVARSGTQVLRVGNPSEGEFSPGPLVINFTSPQRRVKMFAGSEVVPQDATLTAFDANGVQVGQVDGPRSVSVDVFTTAFEVTTPTAVISRVELLYIGGGFEAIDDLEFDGDPPPPPPPTIPVVQFSAPTNGAQIDSERVTIAGTVTGEGVLSPVFFRMDERRRPEITARPFTSALELTGTGTTKQFSLPDFGILPLGPITFTVTAENFIGQQGTQSVSITNLPIPIQNRFAAEGGATTFGEFRFGVFVTGCRVAVYERGAISVDGAGNTLLIRGDILDKWLAPRQGFNPIPIGCPTSEERPTVGNALAQDFSNGRIYAHIPGQGANAFFVPSVFVDVIDKYGNERVFGLPTSDTTDSVGVMQTWLFQRFLRPDEPGAIASTLEIRGTPPRLYMERHGGAWLEFRMAPSERDLALGRSAATLWESFPCDATQGPCTVPEDPDRNFPPPSNPDVGDRFCGGTTYIPGLEGLVCCPAEWEPIKRNSAETGDYVATPVFGLVLAAHMTTIDNGLTHETHTGSCPAPELLTGDLTCASDFEYFIRPIGPQDNARVSPLRSLFGKKNTDRIKTEYEVHFAAAAHNFLGAPAIGDLIHTTGRWIVDCGHDTYKTELHPIFSFAKMKTVISETNPFTGLEEVLFGGKQATRVAIWVNGWYPGGEGNAIEFDAFPPPRPNPDARLVVTKPIDFAAGGYQAAEDVTMEYRLEPPGLASRVHFRFTAPRRENTVTAAGEYMFEPGRQYWGIWYLRWE